MSVDAGKSGAQAGGGFHGTLDDLSLLDMLQLLHFGQHTVKVRVDGAARGEVFFEQGEIVHASAGDSVGVAAMTRLLESRHGQIKTERARATQRTIDLPFQLLVLDVLRAGDESRKAELDIEGSIKSYPAPALSIVPDGIPTLPSLTPAVEPVDEIQSTCRDIVNETDGVVACAVIDIESGAILGGHTIAAELLLRGDPVAVGAASVLRDVVNARREAGEGDEDFAPEVQVASGRYTHFVRMLVGETRALLLVTPRSVSLGLGRALLGTSVAKFDHLSTPIQSGVARAREADG